MSPPPGCFSFCCFPFSFLLLTMAVFSHGEVECLALDSNYSSLWRKMSLVCSRLLQPWPQHTWISILFPLVLFTGVLVGCCFQYAFCVLPRGDQKGTWRSQMAYLFPQETCRYLAGHLPSSSQDETPLFGEKLVANATHCHWWPSANFL